MIKHGFSIKDYKNHICEALKTTDPSNGKIVLRYVRHTRGKKLFREIGCLKIDRNNLRYIAEI